MIKAVFGSFYPGSYRELSNRSLSGSFVVLAVLILGLSTVLSLKSSLFLYGKVPGVITWVNDNFKYFSDGLPHILIEEGRLIEPEQTYFKQWEGFTLIIEPDKEKAAAALEQYGNLVLLGSEQALVKSTKSRGVTEIKSYSLKEIKRIELIPQPGGVSLTLPDRKFLLNPLILTGIIMKASGFIFPVLLGLHFIVNLAGRFFLVFVFSFISLLINNFRKAGLRYRQLLNIGIYGLFPSMIAGLARDISGLRVPCFTVFYFGLYVFYIFLGIKHAGETHE